MPSKTLTISFVASGGVHLALLGGLMVTGYQLPSSAAHSNANVETTIDFGAVPLARPDVESSVLPPRDVVTRPDVPPVVQMEKPRLVVVEPVVKESAEPPEVKLGIDDGKKESKNWIGFADPTEFRAPKSTVDQAEVAINPGQQSIASGAVGKPGNPGAPGMPGDAGARSGAGALSMAPSSVAQPVAKVPEAAQANEEQKTAAVKGDGPQKVEPKEKVDAAHATLGKPERVSAAATPFDRPVPPTDQGVPSASATDAGDDALSRDAVQKQEAKKEGSVLGSQEGAPTGAEKKSEEKAVKPLVTSPSAAAEVAPAVSASRPAEQGNQGQRGSEGNNASGANFAGDKPGEKDDREADASAVIDSIEVVPGKPAAAKGLRIQTSRPQWSMATKLTARPRNPTVRITFGPTGRVSKAEFVAGKNSGYVDVDQPLLNAVYRWTARGEAIDKLNAGEAKSGVTITVNILLN